jgi:hypothetical protein
VKVIIIGGVAGGASCAARLRRLDEISPAACYRARFFYPIERRKPCDEDEE